eukprot:Rmarinus@m.26806
MRLAVSQLPSNKHTELVSAVGWNNTNELYSYGDDKAVWKWSMEGEPLQSLKEDFDAFATDMHWMPTLSRTKTSSSNTEIFALACTDGTLRLVNKAANVTKKSRRAQGGCDIGAVELRRVGPRHRRGGRPSQGVVAGVHAAINIGTNRTLYLFSVLVA